MSHFRAAWRRDIDEADANAAALAVAAEPHRQRAHEIDARERGQFYLFLLTNKAAMIQAPPVRGNRVTVRWVDMPGHDRIDVSDFLTFTARADA